MKLFKLSALLFVFACGGDGDSGACSDSSFIGAWVNGDESETLTFKSSCAGTSAYCGANFEFPNLTEATGEVLINVTSTNGNPGCFSLGEIACEYAIVGNEMGFDCGDGVETYTKQ